MVSLDVWYDKLPKDKAEYYNKSRMSIELFSRKLGIAYQTILADLERHGYYYHSETRIIDTTPKRLRTRGK